MAMWLGLKEEHRNKLEKMECAFRATYIPLAVPSRKRIVHQPLYIHISTYIAIYTYIPLAVPSRGRIIHQLPQQIPVSDLEGIMEGIMKPCVRARACARVCTTLCMCVRQRWLRQHLAATTTTLPAILPPRLGLRRPRTNPAGVAHDSRRRHQRLPHASELEVHCQGAGVHGGLDGEKEGNGCEHARRRQRRKDGENEPGKHPQHLYVCVWRCVRTCTYKHAYTQTHIAPRAPSSQRARCRRCRRSCAPGTS